MVTQYVEEILLYSSVCTIKNLDLRWTGSIENLLVSWAHHCTSVTVVVSTGQT